MQQLHYYKKTSEGKALKWNPSKGNRKETLTSAETMLLPTYSCVLFCFALKSNGVFAVAQWAKDLALLQLWLRLHLWLECNPPPRNFPIYATGVEYG